MLGLVVLLASAAALDAGEWDPVQTQIQDFKDSTDGPIGTLTTSNGEPVCHRDATVSLNTRLLRHSYFMDTVTHVAREKIPERIVHAKGTAAFGYFEVTHDISHICKAKFLSEVGKKTPVAVRFSTTQGSKGASDLSREARGFSMKFYTEEGNLDLPGFNTPIYFYRDPINFSNFVHALGRNPGTFVPDRTTFWDFLTYAPDALFLFLMVFSDRGIPASYKHMPGFAIHTYQVVNKYGENHFIRFHVIPDAGIKNLHSAAARNISAYDPDYLSRDLYQLIGKKEYPTWTINVQMLSESDVKKHGNKVFDVTRIISTKEFPLHPVGKLVLNKNFNNFHAQVEQLAFCPSNLVPGILGGPDLIYESRILSYRDTQFHRLGGNFKKIPVNCPFQSPVFTINRDGVSPVGDNGRNAPNYYPNSFNGAVPLKDKCSPKVLDIVETVGSNNFDQVKEYYQELESGERNRLIENVVDALQPAIEIVQHKVIKLFKKIDKDFGYRVAKLLDDRQG